MTVGCGWVDSNCCFWPTWLGSIDACRPIPPRCVEPVCPPATDCFDRCPPRGSIPFSDYLEEQNRREREVRNVAVSQSQESNRAQADMPNRPQVPRIGDVTPSSSPAIDRKVRQMYRIELPFRAGHIIDVFA